MFGPFFGDQGVILIFLANIVVKSDRKMASKNSFQSTDGQSQKMGEKTQQVLRLIAALISSYLFCWETDITIQNRTFGNIISRIFMIFLY